MVLTLREALQRPAKGYFTTVHVNGQAEGEVEPHFYEEFKAELGRIWCLFDSKGFQLRVEFNNDDDFPKITNGWLDLREHYNFKRHHSIFFKYLGENLFQIIPTMEPIYPAAFPTWHTESRGFRKAVTFKTTITEDPEVVPYLTLPDDMGKYLWNTMLDKVRIVNADGEQYICDLEYKYDPFVVRIVEGWSCCVGINGFKLGDRILFNMRNIYDGHTIWVAKLG